MRYRSRLQTLVLFLLRLIVVYYRRKKLQMGAKNSKTTPNNITTLDAVRIIHVLPAPSPLDEFQRSGTASSVWEDSVTDPEEEDMDGDDEMDSVQSYPDDSDSESCADAAEVCHKSN